MNIKENIMKVLVTYDDMPYLITATDSFAPDFDELFHDVNKGRWPNEIQPKCSIKSQTTIIAFFTDNSHMI